jgi:hypothetical protein
MNSELESFISSLSMSDLNMLNTYLCSINIDNQKFTNLAVEYLEIVKYNDKNQSMNYKSKYCENMIYFLDCQVKVKNRKLKLNKI